MLQILIGDALAKLRELPTESVQCCVTSPPYCGLRDYGTATWAGGAEDCDHIERTALEAYNRSTLGPKRDGLKPDNAAFKARERTFADACGKCGAKRIDAQLGLEKTPEEYVARMVGIFREVRRVLRKDGTLWLNLGDSYANAICGPRDGGTLNQWKNGGRRIPAEVPDSPVIKAHGLKPKDLIGIPWRVAFALQSDGWWLRQDIIWSKPNPMPESVTDRCTKAHEYIFLLTKSSRYFYDAEAIAERAVEGFDLGLLRGTFTEPSESIAWHAKSIWDRRANGVDSRTAGNGTRNKRSVWTVATQPYPEAHFATYPPDLIKPCILAGTRHGDTVLDPFAGSGTTGMVALELGRKAILIELNPKYAELIEQRCTTTIGLPF